MFKKVHFILGLFVALYFLPYVNNKIVFFPVVLIASFIPDFDLLVFPRRTSKFSKLFDSGIYKDFMHSYTFCIALTILLVFFYPVIALPFFIGYSFHLFFDSLTTNGIRPFWPLKTKSKGFISPGGVVEKTITTLLLILTLILILKYLI